MLIATWIGAVATAVLAVGAGFTVYYAKQAFEKQSLEVGTLQKQASDQAEMLRIQSNQLDAQHDQLHEQQMVNQKQTEVLELQARELKASIEQRERDAAERRRAQATRVFVWEERHDHDPRVDQATLAAGGERPRPTIEACVKNASEQPIYDLLIRWHRGQAPWGEGELARTDYSAAS
jgi:TolA-binding protein